MDTKFILRKAESVINGNSPQTQSMAQLIFDAIPQVDDNLNDNQIADLFNMWYALQVFCLENPGQIQLTQALDRLMEKALTLKRRTLFSAYSKIVGRYGLASNQSLYYKLR